MRSDLKKPPYHLTSICWSLQPVRALSLSLCLPSIFSGIFKLKSFFFWSRSTQLGSLCHVTFRSIQMQMCFMIPEETCAPPTQSDRDFHFLIGCSAIIHSNQLPPCFFPFFVITGHILKKAGLYHCSRIIL